jgi:hypothetical protein
MKIRLFSKENIKNVFSSIRKLLEEDGFIIEEKDRTYEFKKTKENFNKHLVEIQFWAKKSSFNDFPSNYSILIEGQIKSEKETIIEIELKEYHGDREHTMAGSLILEGYIDFFYKIL